MRATTGLKSKLRQFMPAQEGAGRQATDCSSDARLGINLISIGDAAAAAAAAAAWAVVPTGVELRDEGRHEEGDQCALAEAR